MKKRTPNYEKLWQAAQPFIITALVFMVLGTITGYFLGIHLHDKAYYEVVRGIKATK